jgi:hypothetical protein
MTIGSLKIFKAFKKPIIVSMLDLTKVMAPSKKNEKQSPIVVHEAYK